MHGMVYTLGSSCIEARWRPSAEVMNLQEQTNVVGKDTESIHGSLY